MDKKTKRSGEARRQLLVKWLKESESPLSGNVLAEQAEVSRQVIVQDISLLKAGKEPIVATSRGYVYWNEEQETQGKTTVVAVDHTREQTQDELYTLVDLGVFVKNVMVEHPIYGDLTGSLMLKNRRDVDAFLQEMETKEASLLLHLTSGIHLHTLEAETDAQLKEAKDALREAGYLLES